MSAAGRVPVTLKFRIGIDERVQTYLDSGRIAQDEGCAAVGLHEHAETEEVYYLLEGALEMTTRAPAAHPDASSAR